MIQLSDQEFGGFRSFIHREAGIHLQPTKKPLVAGRLLKRVRELSMPSYGDYLKHIERDAAERQLAVDLLTTNETYFFREPKHFDFLREVLGGPWAQRPSLRIWSAACSSGQEPYTLAMVLDEMRGSRGWEVLATDISTRVLEKARTGIYPIAAAESVPVAYRKRYCLRGEGKNISLCMVDPALAKRVEFRQLNLNERLPAVGQFAVIFLRNVMIYFDADTKRRIVERLVEHLEPGGYLVISHSESLHGLVDCVQPVRPSIYRKPDVAR